MDPRVKAGIFKGESGGDYNTLFSFSNRPGGAFSNVRLTDMTVDDAIRFTDPSGPYAQYVKNKIGRVATPVGAFQVVGTTLRAAKKALGLSGSEQMSPELQDKIGEHILATQGTGAWAGYRGPSDPTAIAAANTRYDPRSDTPSTAHPTGSTLPGPPPAATGTPLTPGQATGEPLPPYPTAGAKDRKTLGEIMGGAVARMGAQPEPASSLPGIAKPQITMSLLPSMPFVDPGQQDMRRQQLAMLMQRLNSGLLV